MKPRPLPTPYCERDYLWLKFRVIYPLILKFVCIYILSSLLRRFYYYLRLRHFGCLSAESHLRRRYFLHVRPRRRRRDDLRLVLALAGAPFSKFYAHTLSMDIRAATNTIRKRPYTAAWHAPLNYRENTRHDVDCLNCGRHDKMALLLLPFLLPLPSSASSVSSSSSSSSDSSSEDAHSSVHSEEQELFDAPASCALKDKSPNLYAALLLELTAHKQRGDEWISFAGQHL